MMQVPFLDLQAQYQSLRPEIDEAMQTVLDNSSYVGRAKGFEAAFASFVGTQYCVGVGNGTDALELALEALELPAGSEVIVPGNSFIGSSEAVSRSGLEVTFADVDETYTLDPADVARRVSPNTSAIMPVHLYGRPCDMKALQEIADEHDLKIIEDCAQAHGARIDGQHVGSFGDIACFSFYPGKNLGAYGDGGGIVTDDEHLEIRARMLANHGRLTKYNHELEGRSSRLDGIQAAVLSTKLPHLGGWIGRRREVAAQYLEGLDAQMLPATLPAGVEHAYHLFVIRVEDRDALQATLKEAGIATGVHYPSALPSLSAYSGHQNTGGDTPNSNSWAANLLSLPIGEHLSDDQVAYVIDQVGRALAD